MNINNINIENDYSIHHELDDQLLNNKIRDMENTYYNFKKKSGIYKYNNNLYFLDKVYKKLNSNFSKAYLQGSCWYIGDTLINNNLFVYPPSEILICWGFTNMNCIYKSKIILNILYQYIKNQQNL